MSVYLVANTWPALNPWRAIAAVLPRWSDRSYPAWLGRWPSAFALLGLVWVEVITPLAEGPRLLSFVVVAYSLVTLVGGAVYGAHEWFTRVDPVSQVFRCYGHIAPFQRSASGIALTLPGTALTRARATADVGGPVFVVALLWATTYDGLISTAAWAALVRGVVGVGVPPLLVYAVTMLVGYGVFLAIYTIASRLSRRTGETYVSDRVIGERFAPSLLPIAAGYHLAHFLGYFLTLSPALVSVLAHPFSAPADPQVLVLPEWFVGLQLLVILIGHVLAIWVAHGTAFDLFTGRLQPIRSQYPFIVVMICYTVTSMWIVIQPYSPPPFV